MCLGIAMTAAYHGANIANYVQVIDFIKEENKDIDNYEDQKIIGVRLRDNLTGQEWNTFCKVVINATGCGVDALRNLDNSELKESENLIVPSRGTHIILPGQFSSKKYGMLIPKTADGRVAFLLPFEGNCTMAGTTDVAMEHSEIPNGKNIQLVEPTQSEVSNIIGE